MGNVIRFHLSTLLVVSLTAGGLLCLNLTPSTGYRDRDVYGFPETFALIPTERSWNILLHRDDWHLLPTWVYKPNYYDGLYSPLSLGLNIAFLIAACGTVGFFFEIHARKKWRTLKPRWPRIQTWIWLGIVIAAFITTQASTKHKGGWPFPNLICIGLKWYRGTGVPTHTFLWNCIFWGAIFLVVYVFSELKHSRQQANTYCDKLESGDA